MEYVYAALLLHKLGHKVDDVNLTRVISATGAKVDEAKVKLLANALKDVDIDKELENAAVSTPVASSQAPAVQEKKEEKKHEASAAAEGLSSLFG